MTIATVRRLAADIMDVGENKVKISPDGLKESFYKHYELWTDLNNGELGKVRLLRTAQQ